MRLLGFGLLGMASLGFLLATASRAEACTWDAAVNKCHPTSGEVVAYDRQDCTAQGGSSYVMLIDKAGLTYKNLKGQCGADGVCNWNDKISCFVVGPKTKFRIYQKESFKGKQWEVTNNETSFFQASATSTPMIDWGWWDNSASSVKVWKL